MNIKLALIVILLGLATSQEIIKKYKNLLDISASKERAYSYTYTYYNYSWIYYVCSAIFICISVFSIIRSCCWRTSYIQTPTTIPLVANQAYTTNPQYGQQTYTNQPNVMSNNNQGVCTICNQPLGGQNSLDPINSGTLILQCTHSFHYGCIANVMKTRNQCPICYAMIQQPQQGMDLQGEVPMATAEPYNSA